MSRLPLISIVTVSYNAAATIEDAIRSVLQQTYPHIEYIVIDGGSKDGTVDLLRRYDTQISHWVSEPDKGIYDAMNKGIALATGEYIGFLNADDFFANNDSVQKIVDHLLERFMLFFRHLRWRWRWLHTPKWRHLGTARSAEAVRIWIAVPSSNLL